MLKIPLSTDASADALELLPEQVRPLVREKGEILDYRPGDAIVAPGDTGDRIRFLMSGQASVMLRDEEDQEVAVDSLQRGDIFGEISFITGKPSPSDSEVVADEHCQVLEIPSRDFEEIVKESPEFALSVVQGLARKVMRLDRQILRSKVRRRALQALISREEHIFPDYVIGDYVRKHLVDDAQELAHSEGPVLIVGETGVGKEVLAHAIYRMSHHHKDVFLLLDLHRGRVENPFGEFADTRSASNNDATEDQMRLFFGSEEMGPDGKNKETPGYVELTEDGTLLVRGVEHLTSRMQSELLKAISTGEFRRVGGSDFYPVRTRLIATTELDPAEISPEKHPLAHGLLDRSLSIPPLRKRRREISGLVEHYLTKYSQELRKEIVKVPPDTLKTLVNYTWPGNDLELSTTLKRAVMVSEEESLKPEDIYFHLKRVEGVGKFNLLRFRPVRQSLLSPLFPAILQSAVTPFFFILLVLLFLGPADPLQNPGALFSWALGWPMLVFGAFLWARFWCTLCPIGFLSNLAKKVIALEKPFPAFLRNHSDFLVAAAVLFIIWLETATTMRSSPLNVGLLLVAMLVSALFVAVIYERQSWCRYLCGLGGMIGVLAKTSLLEMRADRNVCISQCASNECFLGTGEREGCPFGQAGPKLHSNRLCKMCATCLKNCPHSAINLNLRVPAQELWEIRHTNTGTAFLVIGMVGGLLCEMIAKTPIYSWLTDFFPGPPVVKFSIIFCALIIVVNLMLICATSFSYRVYGDSFEENYSRYGLALLPLVLGAFAAFHVYYLINLGVQLPILVSRMFDLEILKPLIITVPPHVTRAIQQTMVWLGFAWTLMVIYRLGRASTERFSTALAGLIPHTALALALAVLASRIMDIFFYGANASG
ncbi:MAG: cyclic nucleotide-binding domain-containing protein [Deltaproteobacteria bacterium]|nr:cyclic nucleotide-binding domain-containing protein [Deltaproteobacteria bacterium]